MARTVTWILGGLFLVAAPTAWIAVRLRDPIAISNDMPSEDVAVPVAALLESSEPPTPQKPGSDIPPVSQLIDPSGEKRRDTPKMAIPAKPFEAGPIDVKKRTELNATESAGQVSASKTTLRREGSQLLNVEGAISTKGSRYTFLPADGSSPLSLHENQVLERIEQQEQGRPADAPPRRWKVSGRVTEYRGGNGLLATSAVLIEPDKTK